MFYGKEILILEILLCALVFNIKNINIGRGGMILLNSKRAYNDLLKMSYDGRNRDLPWRNQNIKKLGYHYYMTPESAEIGMKIFKEKRNKKPKLWTFEDYPDLSKMKVFNL